MVVIFWLWQLLSASAQAPPVPGHDADGAFTVALGVTCSHCHTPGDWLDERQPAFGVARRMMAMRAFLEAGPTARTQCFMCHQGQVRPATAPPK